MREILYRGKRVELVNGKIVFGDWVYGYYYNNDCPSLLINGKHINAEYILVQDSYGDVHCLGNLGSPSFFQVLPETVGQFTGLTDKNGKKLFEGDICRVIYIDRRCNSSGEHYKDENLIIEEVVFKKGTFCFKTTIEDIAMYRPIGFDIYEKQKIKYFEIIGNIHDNPELLESE